MKFVKDRTSLDSLRNELMYAFVQISIHGHKNIPADNAADFDSMSRSQYGADMEQYWQDVVATEDYKDLKSRTTLAQCLRLEVNIKWFSFTRKSTVLPFKNAGGQCRCNYCSPENPKEQQRFATNPRLSFCIKVLPSEKIYSDPKQRTFGESACLTQAEQTRQGCRCKWF